MSGEVAGILLAAGAGLRFGRPKALVEFQGEPLVERGVRTMSAGGCRPVIVVLGASAPEVQETCELGRATVVVNHAWDEGMGGSLKAGIGEARRVDAQAVVVMPVDQPLVSPRLVARLIQSWRDGAPAVVAAYGGQGRTPVALDRSLFCEVESSAVGDVGARGYLRSHADLVTLVDCDDVGADSDIDTPEDLEKLEATVRTREIDG